MSRTLTHAVTGRPDLERRRANCTSPDALAHDTLHFQIWAEIARTGPDNCRPGETRPVKRDLYLQAVGVIKGCADASDYHARCVSDRMAAISKVDGSARVLSRCDGAVSAHQKMNEFSRCFYTDLQVTTTKEATA